MWKEAAWIGVPSGELERCHILEGDLTGRFAYYRLKVELTEVGKLEVDVTANSRYRLWVNGKAVLSGPCKGDKDRCYYDTVELTDYLKPGKNILAVQVLYCNPDTADDITKERASIIGVLTPAGGHRLVMEGDICDQSGKVMQTVTTGKADWRVYLDGSFYLKSNEILINMGAICEEIDLHQTPSDWKKEEYDAGTWCRAENRENAADTDFTKRFGFLPRFLLCERTIPLMYETEDSFEEELETSCIKKTGILKTGAFLVNPGEERVILLDAGRIKNGYPAFFFQGGENAEVSITYFEKFMSETDKIRRDDAEHGKIIGLTDTVILKGGEVCYEPFWYRTFRFLRIRIRADQEAVTIAAPKFLRTGYPLHTESWITSSEAWVEEVWKLCLHTLENCMMETYMDCPYYEQMQYPMDTRLQAMFNYAVSTDTRLARKALEDFHSSKLPCGLIQGRYPSAYRQVISTFSLHYIFMLLEYYRQTGEVKTVKEYLPDVDGIIGYYERRIGEDGLVGRLGYWEFVDWQAAWDEYAGRPAALWKGPSTIINLMFGYALKCAADLHEAAGHPGMAQDYKNLQTRIVEQIHHLCWSEERGMYSEGPQFEQYTQHAQAWAVLNGAEKKERAKQILKNAMDQEDVIQCSFSTAYEWFRAMETAGLYGETKENMMRWAALPSQGCTACPEEPENGRSECHAWSALPLYEMVCVMAGIRASEPGWKSVCVRPHMEYLSDLQGEAVTPKGKIRFDYHKENGEWNYQITLPEGMDGKFVKTDGNEIKLHRGENRITDMLIS